MDEKLKFALVAILVSLGAIGLLALIIFALQKALKFVEII